MVKKNIRRDSDLQYMTIQKSVLIILSIHLTETKNPKLENIKNFRRDKYKEFTSAVWTKLDKDFIFLQVNLHVSQNFNQNPNRNFLGSKQNNSKLYQAK